MGAISAGGEPLPDTVRKELEVEFSADFSSVRVHPMGAPEMAKAGKAKTFSTGKDIFFAPGAYAPNSSEGRKLLAHELTHIVQQ